MNADEMKSFKGRCNKCWQPYETIPIPVWATVTSCPNCGENIHVDKEDGDE
jgi:rRNA maturation endonuclease Nob1